MTTSEYQPYVHQIDDQESYSNGRWIVAHWNERNSQWQSSNLRPGYFSDNGYAYTYGRTLSSLAKLGIATYATRASACRAARRAYGVGTDATDDSIEFPSRDEFMADWA